MKVVARGGIDGPTFRRAGLLHRHGDFTMPGTLTGCETKNGDVYSTPDAMESMRAFMEYGSPSLTSRDLA